MNNGNCGWKGGKIISWLLISLNLINISQGIILPSADREIRKDSFYPNQNNKKKNQRHKEKEKSKKKGEENQNHRHNNKLRKIETDC